MDQYTDYLPYVALIAVPLFLALMIIHGVSQAFRSGMSRRDRLNGMVIMLMSSINIACIVFIVKTMHIFQF